MTCLSLKLHAKKILSKHYNPKLLNCINLWPLTTDSGEQDDSECNFISRSYCKYENSSGRSSSSCITTSTHLPQPILQPCSCPTSTRQSVNIIHLIN